jgi:uncharacterized protein YecE (DUF72 family)
MRTARDSKRKGEVLVGISSWTEPTLVKAGTFYPPEAKSAEDRLKFYASQFPIVEVDSSYYYPPSERNSALWAERTPKQFTFNVKAYSLLTQHPTKVDSLFKEVRESLPEELSAKRTIYAERMPSELVDEVWERFSAALMPLHSAGKLGSILFQFPQYFVISRKNKDYLLEVRDRLKEFRIAVEFRHKSWMEERNREETLSFLEEHDLPYVCVDMPQGFVSSVPPVAVATSKDLAVVRFHGRNRQVWEKKTETAAERFEYEYSQGELEGWVSKIDELASSARETHVVMNNCYRDYAVNNARQLASLLD